MATPGLIPGEKYFAPPNLYAVYSSDEHYFDATWDWASNLSVTLSIAGALSLAYSQGFRQGYGYGWVDKGMGNDYNPNAC